MIPNASAGARPTARPKTPGLVNGALALAVLVLVAAIALTARQPPPPSIAEFAPQATEQIKNAPTEQSSQFGSGAGGSGGAEGGGAGGAGGAVTTTSSTLPATPVTAPVDVARVRRCIGDPPRQIEDPQSPPCVPYWQGDNGGATWKGVTRDEIRVAVPTALASQDDIDDYTAFFNNRFEFYGRKLHLMLYVTNAKTIPQQLADAQAVDDMNVFADLSYQGGSGTDLNGKEYYFYDELARRKIVSVESFYDGPPTSDQAHLSKFAPYQWTYLPSVDQIERGLGDMVCKSLVGRAPAYGGVGTREQKSRKFGVLQITYTDGTPPLNIKPLADLMEACDAPYVVIPFDSDNGDNGTTIVKLKTEGVTTVIPLIHTASLVTLMPTATSNTYFPEWIASNFIHQDDDPAATTYPSEQSSHLIGLRSMNKPGPVNDLAWYWARKEANPSYSAAGGYGEWDFLYWNLLVLASGIQMAGPNLTPAKFEAGLMAAKFPNPGGGNAPYYQGSVGFGPGNHSMVNDFATIWWDQTQRSYEYYGKGQGAYCYADRGLRYAPGLRPPGDLHVYQGQCY